MIIKPKKFSYKEKPTEYDEKIMKHFAWLPIKTYYGWAWLEFVTRLRYSRRKGEKVRYAEWKVTNCNKRKLSGNRKFIKL